MQTAITQLFFPAAQQLNKKKKDLTECVTPWISCKLHLQSVIIIQAVDFLQHSDLRPRYFTETLDVPHYLHSYVLISVEQTHNMQRCI